MAPAAPGLSQLSHPSLWGTGYLSWIGPGLGQVLSPVAGELGYCIWQHFQNHGTGEKSPLFLPDGERDTGQIKNKDTTHTQTVLKQNKCLLYLTGP